MELPPPSPSISIPFWSDFNSQRSHHKGPGRWFQSHFGLILTVAFINFYPKSNNISIPFWSDFNSYSASHTKNHPNAFQSHFGLILTITISPLRFISLFISIPFWSDFNHRQRDNNSPQQDISIPFWSDFNRAPLGLCIRSRGFQSHFGLILTHPLILLRLHSMYFNPILVWF